MEITPKMALEGARALRDTIRFPNQTERAVEVFKRMIEVYESEEVTRLGPSSKG